MRQDLLIYGAGDFGREARWLAELLGRWNIIGFCDDGKHAGEEVDGLPVLTSEEVLKTRTAPLHVIFGFADPRGKAALWKKLRGFSHLVFPTLIAPDAYVERDAILGDGCYIGHFCFVSAKARLGRFVMLNTASQIGHDCRIGDFCSFMPMADISGHVVMGAKRVLPERKASCCRG
ncbi:MAG: acetyltransferase [Pyramidobacter sp.]|jgi:sugar O-acyltransferase (sialic acid O-acetyltransferase NeuD family)